MRMANKRTIDGSPTYVEPPSHTVHAFYENWQTKEPLISKETKWRRIVRFLLNDGYCSKIFLKFMLSFNPFVEISSKQASDALLFNLSVGAPVEQQLGYSYRCYSIGPICFVAQINVTSLARYVSWHRLTTKWLPYQCYVIVPICFVAQIDHRVIALPMSRHWPDIFCGTYWPQSYCPTDVASLARYISWHRLTTEWLPYQCCVIGLICFVTQIDHRVIALPVLRHWPDMFCGTDWPQIDRDCPTDWPLRHWLNTFRGTDWPWLPRRWCLSLNSITQ